jgi:hypothetical protein
LSPRSFSKARGRVRGCEKCSYLKTVTGAPPTTANAAPALLVPTGTGQTITISIS